MAYYKLNRLLLGFSVICALALLFSFLGQFLFHHQPCFLCHLQRLAYLFVGVVSFLGYFSSLKKIFIYSLIILLAASAIVSGYHFFVQQGWVKDFCLKHALIDLVSFDQILLQESFKSRSCANSSWTIFNVPLSLYNFFIFASELGFILKLGLFSLYRKKVKSR